MGVVGGGTPRGQIGDFFDFFETGGGSGASEAESFNPVAGAVGTAAELEGEEDLVGGLPKLSCVCTIVTSYNQSSTEMRRRRVFSGTTVQVGFLTLVV